MRPRVLIGLGFLLAGMSLQSCCGNAKFVRPAEEGEFALQTAPAGKALVNFHRPSNWGCASSYPVFDREVLIGNTRGKGRFQYVCDPGEHVFIGKMGGTCAIRADLIAGAVYDIEIHPAVGITMIPIKSTEQRAVLPDWEKKEPLLFLVENEASQKYAEERRPWAKKTLARFLSGPNKDELKTLGKDEHR